MSLESHVFIICKNCSAIIDEALFSVDEEIIVYDICPNCMGDIKMIYKIKFNRVLEEKVVCHVEARDEEDAMDNFYDGEILEETVLSKKEIDINNETLIEEDI